MNPLSSYPVPSAIVIGGRSLQSASLAAQLGYRHNGEDKAVDLSKWLRNRSYVVASGPPDPISLLDVLEQCRNAFHNGDDPWFAQEPFAVHRVRVPTFVGLRSTAVSDSYARDWNAQSFLLESEEYVPEIAEVAWVMLALYQKLGIRLLQREVVRTATINSKAEHVAIGGFDRQGLEVSVWPDLEAKPFLGLAAGRRLA